MEDLKVSLVDTPVVSLRSGAVLSRDGDAFSTRTLVEETCRAATWSSFSTFIRHYRIDQVSSAEATFVR